MTTGPFNPGSPITIGRDWNFFQEVTPGSSGAATFAWDSDVIITFSTATVTFWAPTGTVVQYSFNGNTVHGTLDGSGATAPQSLIFQNRVISKIWFTYTTGSGLVRVEAWAVR